MNSNEIAGLTVPEMTTGDSELEQLIRAFYGGTLDAEGEDRLIEELADNSGMEEVPSHRNDLGDGCPYGSMDRYFTEDGTCPLYCHEADVLVGFDAGDRELPESTDLPPELYEDDGQYKHAMHPDVYP